MCRTKMAVNVSEPDPITRRTNSHTVRTTSNRSQPSNNNTTYLPTNSNTNNSYNNNNNSTSYTPQSNTNNSSSSRSRSSSSYRLNSSTATAEASISSLSSLRNTLPENTHIYDISEIRSATNNFLAKRFSTSSTAPAWRCSLRGREVVLFQRKVLRPIQDAELREKLSVIYKSHHINVIKLLGATIAGGYIYLAYDYMAGANLADCLRNKRNPEFTVLSTWMSRMQIITDLASGLDYIHNNAGLKVNLVHKYVKSSSVIVTEPYFNAKICHFGTAELCGETVVDDVGVEDEMEVKKLVRSDSRSKRFEGVNGYMSPEFRGLATQKSDVYAFGVVILELLTGEEPVKYKYDKASGNHVKILVVETARLALESGNDGGAYVEGRLRRWVDRRLKDSFPVVVVEKLTRIALDCVDEDPSKRPNMSRVAGKVSKLYLDSRKWADTIHVPIDFTASFAPRVLKVCEEQLGIYFALSTMAPKYPKCLKIAREIGDRRLYAVLHAVFIREKKAYRGDEICYSERIEEIQARVDHRHGIILELQKFDSDPVLDECLAALKAEEKADFEEIGFLIQKAYAASVRSGDKSRMLRKLQKLK